MKIVLGALFLLLLLMQLRLWSGPGSWADNARLQGEIEAQASENTRLETRNGQLMEEVRDLRNGLDSIEERARNELGLIRTGETFFLMVDEKPAPPPATVTVDTGLPPAQELPPVLEEGSNPYLDLFRDEPADGVATDPSTQPPGPALEQF